MLTYTLEEILSSGKIGKVKLSDLTEVPEGRVDKNHVVAAKNIRKIITRNYPELIMVKVSGCLNLGSSTIKISLMCSEKTKEDENLKKIAAEINNFVQFFCHDKYIYSEKDKRNFREYNINELSKKYGSASWLYCTIEHCYSNEEKQKYLKKELNQLKKFLGKMPEKQKNKKRL